MTTPSQNPRAEVVAFVTILAAAAGLRLVGIRFGLPYVFYPDEALIVNHAVGFGTGDLNPHYFVYPTLYMYALFLVYGIAYIGGRLVGVFGSSDDFVRLFFTDATPFYLPGRLIAATCGVLTVALAYRLGKRHYGVRVGLSAAALLAFCVYHVTFSHYVKTHVPAGLLVLVAVWFACDIVRGRDGWREYIAAGAAAGAAASTVYHAGLVVFTILVAHMLKPRSAPQRSLLARPLEPKLLAAAAATIALFAAGTPYALLDWRVFFADLRSTGAMYASGPVWVEGPFFPLTSLATTMGAPIAVAAWGGLAYALVRRRAVDLVVASQPLALIGFLAIFATKELHHTVIAFAPLTVLAASLLTDVVGFVVRRRDWMPAAQAIATIAIVAGPARDSYVESRRLALPDTRVAAKAWIEEHIAPGAKIVMDSGKYYLSAFGPPLPMSRWTLEQMIVRGGGADGATIAARDGTRRVSYSGESTYFREQLRVNGNRPGYDIVQILHDSGSLRADVRSLDEYRALGVQYVVVSSFGWTEPASADPAAASKAKRYRDFYEALPAGATLLKELRPSHELAGPTLRIYRIS